VSLRWRIALALAAIAAGTTLAVGVLSYRATSTRLLEEVDSSLRQAWRKIDDDPVIALRDPGLLSEYLVQEVHRSGEIATPRGVEPIDIGPGPAKAFERPNWWSFDTVEVDGINVRLISGKWSASSVLQVGRSLEETERVLHDLRNRTALLVVLVSAAAAVLGWLIARTVTGPLVRLTKAATDVQQSGRLDVEVPVGGKDEVGRLAEAFNGMLAALAASRDDQRRLVEDAGHELRTPLTSVRTNLAVLRRHPDLDPETRAQVLDDLHAETEELVGLVEEVVALARGLTDEAPAEPVELGALAEAVAARARRRHDRIVTVTHDGSVVNAPPPSLERAISNLVDNAAKFDTSGGPIEIEIANGRLVVLDRGPGFSLEDAGRVFDRFYRSEQARSLPGSGLGLAIVREIVERAGGTVEAGNRQGGGAVVGFRLPLVTAETTTDTGGTPLPPPQTKPADVTLEPASGLRPPTTR
jgi:two-component system sensor histidine kinase MprB